MPPPIVQTSARTANEIGFGGPAYPRGYMRLENGAREPWEVDEVRYEWAAPEGSLSDDYRAVAVLRGVDLVGLGVGAGVAVLRRVVRGARPLRRVVRASVRILRRVV